MCSASCATAASSTAASISNTMSWIALMSGIEAFGLKIAASYARSIASKMGFSLVFDFLKMGNDNNNNNEEYITKSG